MTFKELGLNEELLEALGYMNFHEATPIQEQAIPAALNGKDLIACAQTGTGKTAAFTLPIIHKLSLNNPGTSNTLILTPTRELALQIDNQIQGFSYFSGITSLAIYGGGDGKEWNNQRKALTQGAEIIIATPGKLISHLNLGYVKFDDIQHLVLDEADRMLDMGFYDDIKKIISYLPKERQNLFFSATMAPKMRKLAQEFLKEPEEISLAIAKPAAGVLQAVYLAYDQQKTALIHELLKDTKSYESIIIFCSTKKKVAEVAKSLKGKGYVVAAVSSDLDQKERELALQEFRAKRTRIIVSTDVLSRGIDIKDINLVMNYDVPSDAADYVHRIGRTARANTTGVAITFVSPDDMFNFSKIEELIERDVIKINVPESLGESPVWKKPTKGKGRRKPFKRKK